MSAKTNKVLLKIVLAVVLFLTFILPFLPAFAGIDIRPNDPTKKKWVRVKNPGPKFQAVFLCEFRCPPSTLRISRGEKR